MEPHHHMGLLSAYGVDLRYADSSRSAGSKVRTLGPVIFVERRFLHEIIVSETLQNSDSYFDTYARKKGLRRSLFWPVDLGNEVFPNLGGSD
jgi:hypothetical protein